jgi:hypothetical protein
MTNENDCSRSASRRLARSCTDENQNKNPQTKTTNENENLKRKPFWFSFWFSLVVLLHNAATRVRGYAARSLTAGGGVEAARKSRS